MSQADLEVNRRTRSVFVRHWIDLGHLSLRSVNGKVTVRGKLNRIFGSKEELTAALVENIFNEIKRIPAVKRVTPFMDNWSNETGVWHQVGGKQAEERKHTAPGTDAGEQETYIIDDDDE